MKRPRAGDELTQIDTLWAEREIRNALHRFCRGADRRDYEILRSAFHDDAWDDHGPYAGSVDGFVEWQKSRHPNIEQCMHAIANCLIEIEGDVAFTETYCIATLHEAHQEGGYVRSSVGCRYIDRFENRGPGWRIALRQVVYEWLSAERVAAIAPSAPNLMRSQRSTEDMIYKIRDRRPGLGAG
jgi:hypothetical protein